MLKSAELSDTLDRLASHFDTQAEQLPGEPELRAWGQFVDTARRHHQTGLYGTASGVIVLQLAGRQGDTTVKQALRTLDLWWSQRDDFGLQPAEWFLQTLRVAYLYMALSRIDDSDSLTDALRIAVAQRLWETQLPGGQWGNYWESKDECDTTPRVLTTALVMISTLVLTENGDAAKDKLERAATWLESKVTSGLDLDPLAKIAALTALIAMRGARVSREVRSEVVRLAYAPGPELGDLGVYFCDYRWNAPDLKWGRDYFIVPKAILLALGGFLPGSPVPLRLRAERILRELVDQVTNDGFLYRPEPDRAAASKDNAWLAILLGCARATRQRAGLWDWVNYELRRERDPNRWNARVFPLTALLSVFGLGVFLQDVDVAWIRVVHALGLLIVGWICGPQVASLFRERG